MTLPAFAARNYPCWRNSSRDRAEDARPTPEELLAQWPTNSQCDRDAASLIFQDFCQRRQLDPDTKLTDYQNRFPAHKETLATLVRRRTC